MFVIQGLCLSSVSLFSHYAVHGPGDIGLQPLVRGQYVRQLFQLRFRVPGVSTDWPSATHRSPATGVGGSALRLKTQDLR